MHQLALFDLDDTLIDRQGAFIAWATEFCQSRGYGPEEHALLLTADAAHTGPRRHFFATIRDRLALAESVDVLWEQYRQRMPDLVTCRAEDLAALTLLRAAGWRLGIVTNGMTDNQTGKIRRTGLDTVVHGWAISDQIGVRKPDPGVFQQAARQCGCDIADGGWMIGDSLDLDIGGGRAAGLRTIWLHPGECDVRAVQLPHGVRAPDHRASSIPVAVALLLDAR